MLVESRMLHILLSDEAATNTLHKETINYS